MKILKLTFSASQIKAVLRKDFLVRWRQPWMSVVQVMWPCMVFMLLYLIRLKFGPETVEDCQFPTRMLPTKNNVLPGFYSYICTIENKCMSTVEYEEYSKFENAPMRPIIDIVQIFINDDSLFNAIVDLPVKSNFINAVTTIVTGGHMDDIRKNVEKVIDLVPAIEKQLNGSFDIKSMFSDRKTFVKSGYLLCGHPFPSTESIPLVNDILYSEDFSEINDDELDAMPTKYCKKLYLDVTTTNHGKLTWETIKPIITGKILYTPDNNDTRSIMQFTNSTFEEINRLKMLSVAVEQILTKLRVDESFQRSFDSLLKLAQSPFVRSLLGDEIDIDQIQAVIHRIRTDPVIYDVINTIKNILECFSVDRYVPVESPEELRKTAYELNRKRLFYAAVAFNKTAGSDVVYKFHMDTENTQPTIENRNRFWFPGPSRSMVRDMKYHRGFVQIKQSLDLGIIKHKKKELRATGAFTERLTTTTESNFNIQVINGDDDEATVQDDDDEDDWFTNQDDKEIVGNEKEKAANNLNSGGLLQSSVIFPLNATNTSVEVQLNDSTEEPNTTTLGDVDNNEEVTEAVEAAIAGDVDVQPKTLDRQKRQSIFDFFSSLGDTNKETYEVDKLQYFTKQFPYPSYIHDDFKTGLYLAQAVQVAFFLGLVAQIASCVRHLIWMRESRNSMLMRSMGLKPCSEMCSWIIVTFIELLIIFAVVTVILYSGGILTYTRWLFIMIFLIIFGACLMSFCYMCSTFFTSASIGSVAAGVFFFISFCPYILVLLFDAKLNSLQNFGINLSFTTAFSYAWSHIMRMELQQTGLSFVEVFEEGFSGDYGFGVFMIVVDMIIYAVIGCISQRYKDDENRFVAVHREDLDASVGATLTNVSKVYDDNKMAVSNINLSFAKNKVTCLLGRNGAGKSTIIKMLTGQVVQTTGRVVLSQAMTVRQDYDKIGVCSQDNILIPNLTAREHLEMYAKIKMKHNYYSEVDKTLKNLNFGKHEGYEVCQLSGGFQRRLCVAIAFIGSPNVVILDEPCNGVDSKARRDIWELIERLRKGRAVVFTTHFLDEAEYLSDAIVIMKNGKIIAQHSPESLKSYGSVKYEVSMQCANAQTSDEIISKGNKLLSDMVNLGKNKPTDLRLEIPYDQSEHQSSEFLKYLQDIQREGLISDLTIETQNLEQLFRQLDQQHNIDATNGNGHAASEMFKAVPLKHDANSSAVRDSPLTRGEAIRQLFWKRVKHFSRNYRMLLCVLVLPAIFELLAMWFVAYRLEDDYDKVLRLSRSELYPKTTQMLSMEKSLEFTGELYASLQEECTSKEFECLEFKESKGAFYWILETLNQYQSKRYGGYSFNDTKSIVWYNNKGYHAMMAWLSDLNTHLFQTEMNSTEYSITAYNEPWKLGFAELSTSSILRQAGDSCMIFILLIAYSLVVAVAAVYLVNERMKGEKLQQRLCGVDAATYWGVAFVWDFLIITMAILVCTTIIIAFNMPVFVARQQLMGIIVLALFFGFACIPAVHVVEKFFTDASVAIVTIFCMNVIIPLFTMAIIVLLGVIGDSSTWDEWRYFLNRLFLIFPQHALGDGLLEIVKNYMVALTFRRYDIDSYKNPVNSDLLKPHLIALTVLGIFFGVLNVLLECGLLHRLKAKLYEHCSWVHVNERKHLEELKIVSIQSSLKRQDKYDTPQVLKVDNLSKSYGRRSGSGYAVRNVTFAVKAGECFGLLGKNGAGKSTIFKMLSGQEYPTQGDIHYFDNEISYCPQTNTLDSLLTVQECIEFYGRLRRIIDIPKNVSYVLEAYQLEAYRNVLVKNLSGGNRRKLTVATTCCGRTSTVLMDEPTSDMDPMTRALVYRTIHSLLAEQRAIVLTSHSISEIDEICHRIAVLKDGQMLTCSSPESLKAQWGGYYNVSVFCDQDKSLDVEKLIRQRIPESVDVQLYSHSVKFSVKIDNNKSIETHKDQQESGIDVPVHMHRPATVSSSTVTLAELFDRLHSLSGESGYGDGLRYAVNRCRLDAVFERILESSDKVVESYIKSDALIGTAATGYTHNGYVDTESETRA